jgi:hypothetical protein
MKYTIEVTYKVYVDSDLPTPDHVIANLTKENKLPKVIEGTKAVNVIKSAIIEVNTHKHAG